MTKIIQCIYVCCVDQRGKEKGMTSCSEYSDTPSLIPQPIRCQIEQNATFYCMTSQHRKHHPFMQDPGRYILVPGYSWNARESSHSLDQWVCTSAPHQIKITYNKFCHFLYRNNINEIIFLLSTIFLHKPVFLSFFYF